MILGNVLDWVWGNGQKGIPAFPFFFEGNETSHRLLSFQKKTGGSRGSGNI